jgi:hypothetical protein
LWQRASGAATISNLLNRAIGQRAGRQSGKESGSFLKKRTKKLLQIQAEPLRKGRSQLSKSFLLLFFKKAGLPAAGLTCGRLPGQLPFLKKSSKKLLSVFAAAFPDGAGADWLNGQRLACRRPMRASVALYRLSDFRQRHWPGRPGGATLAVCAAAGRVIVGCTW